MCNYPKQAKAFYMKENPADPRTVLCDDCLAPEGYGEIIGGSQREDDYDKLLQRISTKGCRSMRTGGTSICVGMARSSTRASASDSSARSPRSAVSRICERRSRSRA